MNEKPYGFEIVVEFCEFMVPASGINTTTERFGYRGVTEGRARRKGMLKAHAVRIVSVEEKLFVAILLRVQPKF